MNDPAGHEGHDLEELPEVWRCCTCGIDLPKQPAPAVSPLEGEVASDGTGLDWEIRWRHRW